MVNACVARGRCSNFSKFVVIFLKVFGHSQPNTFQLTFFADSLILRGSRRQQLELKPPMISIICDKR